MDGLISYHISATFQETGDGMQVLLRRASRVQVPRHAHQPNTTTPTPQPPLDPPLYTPPRPPLISCPSQAPSCKPIPLSAGETCHGRGSGRDGSGVGVNSGKGVAHNKKNNSGVTGLTRGPHGSLELGTFKSDIGNLPQNGASL